MEMTGTPWPPCLRSRLLNQNMITLLILRSGWQPQTASSLSTRFKLRDGSLLSDWVLMYCNYCQPLYMSISDLAHVQLLNR
jgi:hypothetical protein